MNSNKQVKKGIKTLVPWKSAQIRNPTNKSIFMNYYMKKKENKRHVRARAPRPEIMFEPKTI